jgi:hypothetical protein
MHVQAVCKQAQWSSWLPTTVTGFSTSIQRPPHDTFAPAVVSSRYEVTRARPKNASGPV